MVDTLHSAKVTDSSFSRAADRKNQYYSLLYSEMAERRRVEENLRRSNMLLQAVSYAQLQYVGGTGLAQVFSALLHTLLEVTGAHQGYLTESSTLATGSPNLGLRLGVSAQTKHDEAAYIDRISAYIVKTGHSLVIHPANPNNVRELIGGCPSDYYLGLPIAISHIPPREASASGTNHAGAPVGAIILRGAANDFEPAIVELMQPVVVTCAQLIVAQRNDMRRREAEIALADERAQLAQRVKERTAELSYSNAELARAARAKDEFLATMNHELRTPLNAVLLYAESLQLQLPGPLNERQMRAAVGIRESANHLLLLIKDILDVAKMDAGKLSMEIKSISAENLCQSILRLVTEIARKKNIELTYECSVAVNELDADERRLKQMVVNLLSNALKFTPEGGKVGLEVDGDAANNVVTFTVWDTGIGIAQEDLPKLFQPFVQLDSSHVRQHGGTGLGLFLVYRMAELHGGSVSVTSEVGQGSRFSISLPWHQKRPAFDLESLMAAPQHKSGSHGTNGIEGHAAASINSTLPVNLPPPPKVPPRILPARESASDFAVLIADDNESNLRVLNDFLQAWPCEVHIARTGVQAVMRAKEVHPQLVLMDIQMPEMNGLDAIRKIRAETGIAHTPIVALTALAMPGDREVCLAAGADDYVSKPIQIERLTEVLNRFLLRVPMEEMP
jgi:signal transduction histidine kinase/CheY-like chemotaxis protein